MIIDNLSNVEKLLPYVSARLQKALLYLKNTDLQKLSGKVVVDGEDIFLAINEYETKERVLQKAETHIRHIDIQMVLQGAERVYTTPWKANLKVVEDCSVERDAIFYEVEDEDSHILTGDRLAIYFPWDVHRPSCNVDKESGIVRKMVVKVRV